MSDELSNSSDVTLATKDQPVCKFHQYGYCKFGHKCRKLHTTHTCKQYQFSDKTCVLRHPRKCNLCFMQFWGWLLISHKSETSNDFAKEKIEMLKSELKLVLESLARKEIEITMLANRFTDIENQKHVLMYWLSLNVKYVIIRQARILSWKLTWKGNTSWRS